MKPDFYFALIVSIAGTALIIIGFILVQVRNQKKMLTKQQQMAAAELRHQKDLLEAVITSQESERQRIGTDLHDEVGTVLSSLRMLIEKNEPATKELFHTQSKEMIDRVIKNVREIAHNLSPHIDGDHGLYDALHALCDTVRGTGMIRVSTVFDETAIPKNLPKATGLSLYRVLAELINNTLKHAKAKEITIGMDINNETFHIRYADDGVGFDRNIERSSPGMGLQNIESRISVTGGRYTLRSSPGNGMELNITLPLQPLT